MIDEKKLTALLTGHTIGGTLICRERTDSTNPEICRARKVGAGHGTVAVAEEQTAGKGRRGRSWSSEPGMNLYFSMLLLPELAADKAPMLTLAAALAVARAVRDVGLPAQIKWPNDVVVSARKVCGILTELFFEPDGRYYVVVGTGINVNQTVFPEEIGAAATSLRREAKGQIFDREALLARVLCLFEADYGRFLADGGFGGLRADYEAYLVNRNAHVRVEDPKGAWTGTALGIDDGGELLVRRPDGSVETVYAGEVSVRGIYGYV